VQVLSVTAVRGLDRVTDLRVTYRKGIWGCSVPRSHGKVCTLQKVINGRQAEKWKAEHLVDPAVS